KQTPDMSLVYQEDTEKRQTYKDITKQKPLVASKRQKVGIAVVLAFFVILVYGVTTQGWFMVEMSGLFIIMGIVVGLITGINKRDICEAFTDGVKDVLMGAIIVGIAGLLVEVIED